VTVDTLFSHALGILGHGDLVDTGLGWFTLLVNLTLTKTTTANSSSDHNDALLSLVTKSAGSIDTGWALYSAVDRLATPLGHTLHAVHVFLGSLWPVPSLANVLVETLDHSVHLLLEHHGDLPSLYESVHANLLAIRVTSS